MGGVPLDGSAGTAAEVEVELDGVSWTARVGGMSRSGAAGAAAPILLIRFERTGGGEGVPREAWVVGRSLGGLTDLEVEAALRQSVSAPEAWSPKPIFPEAGSRSGNDG